MPRRGLTKDRPLAAEHTAMPAEQGPPASPAARTSLTWEELAHDCDQEAVTRLPGGPCLLSARACGADSRARVPRREADDRSCAITRRSAGETASSARERYARAVPERANRTDAEGATAIPSSPKPEHAFWYLVCWVQLCCHRAVSATVGIATRSRCRYGNRIGGQSDDLRLEISEPRQDGLDSFAGPRVNGPEATNHSRSRRGSAAHP